MLAVAAAVRFWNIGHNSYVVFPDETFQYLEQAHRLAFGSGVVTWEYLEGIRSWLLPGVLALLMRAADVVDGRPQAYIVLIRALCAILSLVVPLLAYTIARRRHGGAAALATGLLCGLWYELVYFSPVVLTEVLAAHIALLAFWISTRAGHRGWVCGTLFGLAACLRYQYAPGVAVLLWTRFRQNRPQFLRASLAALLVIVAVLGGLDWISWGTPFQSVWLNFQRNALDGIGAAMGSEPWYYPFVYFLAAWGPLTPVLVALALCGARQAPGLALAGIITLVSHALTPHKEVRFLYFAIAIAAILIGLGLAEVCSRFRFSAKPFRVAAPIAALLIVSGAAYSTSSGAFPPDAWDRDAVTLDAFARARRVPGLCGLGVRSLYVVRNGAYTYLHRQVPIYYEFAEMRLDGVAEPLPLRVELEGMIVPQFAGPELARHSDRFNVLVGTARDGLPGYERRDCVGYSPLLGAELCIFQRPGPCRSP